MTERRFAIKSLNLIANISNIVAACCVVEWREHWLQVAIASNITTYLFRVLTKLVSIRQEQHLHGYARRAAGIEVGE